MKHQHQSQHQLTPQVCAALFPHLPELELQRDQLTREIEQVRASVVIGSTGVSTQTQPQTMQENEPGNGKKIHSVPQAKANKRKGRKISAEHKAKLSAAAKVRWAKEKAA